MSKKVLAVVLIALTLCAVCFAAAGCRDKEEFDSSFLEKRFEPNATSSYSYKYTQLGSPSHGTLSSVRPRTVTAIFGATA